MIKWRHQWSKALSFPKICSLVYGTLKCPIMSLLVEKSVVKQYQSSVAMHTLFSKSPLSSDSTGYRPGDPFFRVHHNLFPFSFLKYVLVYSRKKGCYFIVPSHLGPAYVLLVKTSLYVVVFRIFSQYFYFTKEERDLPWFCIKYISFCIASYLAFTRCSTNAICYIYYS